MPWKWLWKPPNLRLQIVDCRFEGYLSSGLRLPGQPEPEGGNHTPDGVKEEHEHWSHIPQGKTEHTLIGLHGKNDEEHHQGGPQAIEKATTYH
jgi:hypothetical protein